jgi:isopenicillin N synthase-like dioxygenase
MAPHANDTTTNGASVEVEDSFPDLPPFPSDIPTAPLLRLSLAQLRSSAAESDRLYSACSRLGFFYLDLRGDADGEALLKESEQLFGLGRRLFDNDEGEDLGKYDYSQMGSYMGYKGFAKAVVDGEGTLDRNEFYNVSH